jgi:hypothetical protein
MKKILAWLCLGFFTHCLSAAPLGGLLVTNRIYGSNWTITIRNRLSTGQEFNVQWDDIKSFMMQDLFDKAAPYRFVLESHSYSSTNQLVTNVAGTWPVFFTNHLRTQPTLLTNFGYTGKMSWQGYTNYFGNPNGPAKFKPSGGTNAFYGYWCFLNDVFSNLDCFTNTLFNASNVIRQAKADGFTTIVFYEPAAIYYKGYDGNFNTNYFTNLVWISRWIAQDPNIDYAVDLRKDIDPTWVDDGALVGEGYFPWQGIHYPTNVNAIIARRIYEQLRDYSK